MTIRRFTLAAVLSAALSAPVFSAPPKQPPPPTEQQLKQIDAALPDKAYATPAKPRKILIYTQANGFTHTSILVGAEAIKRMGDKTGAYESVISNDCKQFMPDNLKHYDAVCFVSTTGDMFLPADWKELKDGALQEARKQESILKQSLLDFVSRGKGLVGIHAATDCYYKWSDYGLMVGGYFSGHPWDSHCTVGVKINEPNHPVNAAFEGKNFKIMDEIYQFKEPYSRERLRELLSIDTANTDMNRKGKDGKSSLKRTDNDFAISWVKPHGKGRVFYCSLGHREDIFWNTMILKHYLAGIQYAVGDLKADDSPSGAAK